MGRTSEPTQDASLAAGSTGPDRPEPPIFVDGAMIGARYRLLRLIARGGMGEVYEAEDLELGARIAVKTIRSERIGDPDAAARLKQEILAARKVTHPNVIRLFDVGFHVLPDQREVAFFTMELLAGETLDARVRAAGRLAIADALALARQMADALDALHAAGIVHRDFKSQNVIVVGDRAIVTDFGLARDHHDGATKTTMFEVVGTPGYMAPEQVTRDRAIGPAADIYAFGVVLYEMVTGELPFQRDTALATAAARLEHDPPSPRSRSRDVPPAWDAAILRCLRRDPAQRFAAAGDVVTALTRRRPLPWRAIAIAGGLAAAAAGGYGVWSALRGGGAPACAAAAGPDLFVDARAHAGGTGSRTCPFRTISDALAAPGDRRVVHVAAGFYDRALGERFPLQLRGEVAVIGAGKDLTTIAGVGTFDGTAASGTAGAGTWQASIVAGDPSRPVELADLSLTSGLSTVQRDVVGIVCPRGTLTGDPNTHVRGVVVGPGFGVDILAGTETVPTATGCNLDVADSRLHDGTTGIWQLGCGVGDGRVGVGVRVHGTRFDGFRTTDPVYAGHGIQVWDCARELVVEHSTFADSDIGIDIVRHAGESTLWQRAIIRDNEFDGMVRSGIATTLAVVAEIRDNRFVNVTGLGDFLGHAAALRVYTDGASGPSLVVRGNRFVENDLGVEIWGIAPIPADAELDLGRPDDPGGNTFMCNASPEVSTVPGGDIAVRLAGAPGGHLALAGNRWDHAAPTRATTATNGVDVLDVAGSPLTVDLTGAEFHGREICLNRKR